MLFYRTSKVPLRCLFLTGVRPECLAGFDQECWNLMEQCWSAEPSQRPLLGNVQPKLQEIQSKSIAGFSSGKFSSCSCSCSPSFPSYKPDNSYYYNYDYMQLREYWFLLFVLLAKCNINSYLCWLIFFVSLEHFRSLVVKKNQIHLVLQ